MKRQVIDDILEELAIAKETTTRDKYHGQRLGLERAIRIVLKHADITDLKPMFLKK